MSQTALLQDILSLYLQGLFLSALLMAVYCGSWFLIHIARHDEEPVQQRRSLLFDLIIIYVLTVPIIAFGMVGIQLILRA